MAVLSGCQLCHRTAPRQGSSSTVLFTLMHLGCAELGSMLRAFANAKHLPPRVGFTLLTLPLQLVLKSYAL